MCMLLSLALHVCTGCGCYLAHISCFSCFVQPFTGSVEFRRVLHLVVEALAQQQLLVLQLHEAIISHVLPPIVMAALRDFMCALS